MRFNRDLSIFELEELCLHTLGDVDLSLHQIAEIEIDLWSVTINDHGHERLEKRRTRIGRNFWSKLPIGRDISFTTVAWRRFLNNEQHEISSLNTARS